VKTDFSSDDESGASLNLDLVGSPRVDVHLLPEYYSTNSYAGRSDLRAPRRKIGSLNGTQDLRGAVEKLATLPGAYYAECRVGREVLDSGVFERQPSAQTIRHEPQTQASAAPTPAAFDIE
jgi:hypothetical protein